MAQLSYERPRPFIGKEANGVWGRWERKPTQSNARKINLLHKTQGSMKNCGERESNVSSDV